VARRRAIPIADDLPQRHLLVLINATQTVNAAYIFGLMWMPAVAAILTCRILGRPLRTVGLGTWNGRYVLIGYLIPIAYCLVASLGIWLFGFGGFPNTEFVRQTADAFGLGEAPDWVVIAMFVVLTGRLACCRASSPPPARSAGVGF
jgi:hypothetical protein